MAHTVCRATLQFQDYVHLSVGLWRILRLSFVKPHDLDLDLLTSKWYQKLHVSLENQIVTCCDLTFSSYNHGESIWADGEGSYVHADHAAVIVPYYAQCPT